ncbi:unnamed protein product [Didymodactylos carnosus]|uniref:Uncharacterized protein n=1 Tax=Didymodactylos carnosus TaxID=1234261 RepID=A0A815I4X0_9BILA|nr:unnamed protein product [Didymodactylos carnosus]CAF1363636.1 unnamed protein product [Didymodactylos carnosus]CAF3690425.1 unnamed protein product [Didymodactylos carnosus]CAF4244094.1 unnamed protein product [Didymodactylos carnosus]
MYATQIPIAAVPAPRSRNAVWPLLAICCLALVGIVVAAIIILALIPVYLPKRGENINGRESPAIVIEYSIPADSNSVFTGMFPSSNNDPVARQLEKQLGLANGSLTVKSITSVGNVDRRKRFLLSKRQIGFTNRLSMDCVQHFPPTCTSFECRDEAQKNFQQIVTTIIQISITLILPNGTTITVRLTFLAISFGGHSTTGPGGGTGATTGASTVTNSHGNGNGGSTTGT